jgi:hypothetical protein
MLQGGLRIARRLQSDGRALWSGFLKSEITKGTKAFTGRVEEYAEDSTKPLGLISAVFALF